MGIIGLFKKRNWYNSYRFKSPYYSLVLSLVKQDITYQLLSEVNMQRDVDGLNPINASQLPTNDIHTYAQTKLGEDMCLYDALVAHYGSDFHADNDLASVGMIGFVYKNTPAAEAILDSHIDVYNHCWSMFHDEMKSRLEMIAEIMALDGVPLC